MDSNAFNTMPHFNRTEMTSDQIDHYFEVREARKERGLPVHIKSKIWDRRRGDEHPLLGMRLLNTQNDEEYVVDEVTNEWYDGFFIGLVVRKMGTNSHGILVWENVSSRSSLIMESIETDRGKYEILDYDS